MNIQRQLYQDLAQLPPQELAQLLAEVLPYGEIKARMDGTVVLIHAYGLRRFQSTADLLELGIPEDDPRNEVFTATMQSLVLEKIQNELRNHAARVGTVCRDAGAIEVWEGPRDEGEKMELSKVGKRGRVTIPVEIREKWGLKPWDKIVFVETKVGMMIVPYAEKSTMEALDRIGEALKDKGVTLDELIEDGREIRGQLLEEEYGLDVEDE